MSHVTDRIAEADQYLSERVATFEQRCHRFDCTLEAMYGLGLGDSSTVFDVGAGDGHFGVRLHQGRYAFHYRRPDGNPEPVVTTVDLAPSRARYMPVDACIDGVNLDAWTPPRRADFFVCLELLEHLRSPGRLLGYMTQTADRGVLVSTPNPETTDVLGMDRTHVSPITREFLELYGFHVTEASFYGQPDDSLFAVYSPVFT